jgi:SAM-dependent methyltransferase
MIQGMRPPEWQLPPGVSPGVWEYAHSRTVAEHYDAYVHESPVAALDQAFVDRHFREPGRVADLGCGTGRMLSHLARRGFECVGIDLSEPMLSAAASRARAGDFQVALVRANLVELDCLVTSSFRYALCLFSTLGMIRGRTERRQFLTHVARILQPGGSFIVHAHNRWSNLWQAGMRRCLLRDLFAFLQPEGDAGDRYMPAHQGVNHLFLHLYRWSELADDLAATGLRMLHREFVGAGAQGELRWPWCLGRLRALGFLVLAQRL